MKKIILEKLGSLYELKKKDMKELSHIHSGLYDFVFDTYEIVNIGNLCFIEMTTPLSLMKMETSIITPFEKDLSFCNFDILKIINRYTCMFEMYDTSISKTDLSSFKDIKDKYSHLENYISKSRWYDEYKLDSCIAKKGKKIQKDADNMLEDCFDRYLELLDKAQNCDRNEKNKAVRKYVDRLISEGGVAVDSMKKIIGEEKTAKLVREYMYGVI